MFVRDMSRAVVVIVPGTPPGANQYGKMGTWRIRRERREWRELTAECAGLALLHTRSVGAGWPALSRATIEVQWNRRLKRRRDYDNLVAGLKPLLDGLVDARVIVDDSSDVVVSLGPLRIETGAMQDEVVLTIREA